jgi:DNA-binding MarR family transcriptional regulator/GNAT superfamily N-acetyltransferase
VDQIDLVRDFNRYYTGRLGVLGDHYLGLERPWSESRLLFEIGDGADVRDLRARLGLDSGYLSRMLRSLTAQGLVEVRPHADDGRVRVASLTPAGVAARADLDARARESVGEMLGQLTAAQRERLVAAQEQVRRLLRMAAVTITPVPDSSPVARSCLSRYAAELQARFPSGYSTSALLRPGELSASGGEFLVAFEESLAVGCGAWQVMSPGIAEIRHVWISPGCRGLGLGRRLLERLEAGARDQGIRTLRLGTHTALPEAAALYRSSGYREIPPYDDSAYNELTFEKVFVVQAC